MLLHLQHAPIRLTSISRHTISSLSTQTKIQTRAYNPFSSGLSALSSVLTSTVSSKSHNYHAKRVLQYPKAALYKIVADIESYPRFLPYVLDAQVAAHAAPVSDSPNQSSSDPQQKSLPALATLSIGFPAGTPGAELLNAKGLPQLTFLSNVYCAPERGIVEAVAGEQRDSNALSAEELQRYGYKDIPTANNPDQSFKWSDFGPQTFSVCRTRWTLTEVVDAENEMQGRKASPATEVNLELSVEWKNALLAALSTTAAPKITDMMVQAFEQRARELLGTEGR